MGVGSKLQLTTVSVKQCLWEKRTLCFQYVLDFLLIVFEVQLSELHFACTIKVVVYILCMLLCLQMATVCAIIIIIEISVQFKLA